MVTLALAYDVDAIQQKAGLLPKDWQKHSQQQRSLYVDDRVPGPQGKPEGDHGLERPDQARRGGHYARIPKTSGGARWNYLAAWGYALKRELGDLAKLKDPENGRGGGQGPSEGPASSSSSYSPTCNVLDSGARGATTTFVQRDMGDVLLAWENEAFLSINEMGLDKFEIVVPSISILAEPPVAVVEKTADKHGTQKVAEAYLKSPLLRRKDKCMAAKHYYRPRDPEVACRKNMMKRFPKLELFTIDDVFGGWAKGAARTLRRWRRF